MKIFVSLGLPQIGFRRMEFNSQVLYFLRVSVSYIYIFYIHQKCNMHLVGFSTCFSGVYLTSKTSEIPRAI